jgi:DNA mismatch repair protein MutL
MESKPIITLNQNDIKIIITNMALPSASFVVKELIENSIDANSKNIEITVKDNMFSKIIVKDDGEGIKFEDLKKSIERYTTSKFSNINNINTLGFRGEGLFNITSCAESVIISSKEKDQICGGRMFIKNDKKDIQQISLRKGTTVEVDNFKKQIFKDKKDNDNVYFLKNDEISKLENIINRLALVFYNIDFIVFLPKKSFRFMSCENRYERILEVLNIHNEDFFEKIIYGDILSDLYIEIYLPRKFCQKNTGFKFLSINNRPVFYKNIESEINKTIYQYLGRGSDYLIFINTLSENVDANVNYNKSTIKMINEEIIITEIKKLIYRAYVDQNSLQLSAFEPGSFISSFTMNTIENDPIFNKSSNFESFSEKVFLLDGKDIDNNVFSLNLPYGEMVKEESPLFLEDIQFNRKSEDINTDTETSSFHHEKKNLYPKYRNSEDLKFGNVKCQIFDSFILTEKKDCFLLIDQHAAHERIVYEKMKKLSHITSQFLLTPENISLNYDQINDITKNTEELEKTGFGFTIINKNILLNSVPSIEHPIENAKDFFLDILLLLKNKHNVYDLLLKRIACYSSIKANCKLNTQQMENVIKDLSFTATPGLCNHGRPSIMSYHKKEIFKYFSRSLNNKDFL